MNPADSAHNGLIQHHVLPLPAVRPSMARDRLWSCPCPVPVHRPQQVGMLYMTAPLLEQASNAPAARLGVSGVSSAGACGQEP